MSSRRCLQHRRSTPLFSSGASSNTAGSAAALPTLRKFYIRQLCAAIEHTQGEETGWQHVSASTHAYIFKSTNQQHIKHRAKRTAHLSGSAGIDRCSQYTRQQGLSMKLPLNQELNCWGDSCMFLNSTKHGPFVWLLGGPSSSAESAKGPDGKMGNSSLCW